MTQKRGQRFQLREHTADIAVEATGDSLEDVFAAVADGLGAASCDEIPDETGDRFSLSVTAESREALLFDYLDELIYLRDVRVELPVDHRVEAITHSDDADDAERWTLEASARGVPLADIDAREVKAVTYSEMRLERIETGDGEQWEAYVVFDV
ncbi:archease [Natronorubrum thiooxidans]|uniref:SHS2 domain-containing protein n=1 Tax=Natronorubrum thiooxidans TaxID=308853 RepID=A0A1N7C6I9_9EURY|nr:archease [Natronorubrum thiooxidans]SIR59192.1 SHS2 domain-containing protein [Natronorubrum thiooxidans]